MLIASSAANRDDLFRGPTQIFSGAKSGRIALVYSTPGLLGLVKRRVVNESDADKQEHRKHKESANDRHLSSKRERFEQTNVGHPS
jgi:hypothetical protein